MKRSLLALVADALICLAAMLLLVVAIFTLDSLVRAIEQVRIMPRFW